ncbi:MAG: MATE family efflux transporter [Spirochaetales bacterium]|nr:MATE family efflux transporter [Spirochaetales bacterium]
MSSYQTAGVKTLMGDPKKAIVKLSIPMIIAMSVQTLYNLADAVWVSGIGQKALSAVGFFFPFMMAGMAIGIGIGTGGGASVSRRIGQKDHFGASGVASLSILIVVISGIIYTGIFLFFNRSIFILLGAEGSLEETLSYSTIMFSGGILIFFSFAANSLLRSEGDANRAMMAMLVGAIANIVLDPFFIYASNQPLFFGLKLPIGLNLGIAGAAYATVLSMMMSSGLLVYWLFFEKKTYISFRLNKLNDPSYLRDIFNIGLPATVSQISMAFMMGFLTVIISNVAGDIGVAVFTTGWRIVMVAILPMLGMMTAVLAVSGAAFGAKQFDKLRTAYLYALKIGIIIELIITAATYLLAPQITSIFTWSESTQTLAKDIIELLRLICLFFPAAAGGILSSGMFQGIGKGFKALIITLLRTVILIVPFAFLFAITMNLKLNGVYFGIVVGSWVSAIVAVIWALRQIRNLENQFSQGLEKTA